MALAFPQPVLLNHSSIMQTLPFAEWRQKLDADDLSDYERQALSTMGDYVLRLFWERGASPTIEGLMSDPLEKAA